MGKSHQVRLGQTLSLMNVAASYHATHDVVVAGFLQVQQNLDKVFMHAFYSCRDHVQIM